MTYFVQFSINILRINFDFMPTINLTEGEINELILRYQSERKKLEYQISLVNQAVSELETHLGSFNSPALITPEAVPATPEAAPATPEEAPVVKKEKAAAPKKRGPKPGTKRKRGRPRKNATQVASSAPATSSKTKSKSAPTKAAAKKATKKAPAPKAEAGSDNKGYRLSDWDEFVLTTLTSENKLLSKADLDTFAQKFTADKGVSMSDKQRYVKVSNVLHKLANKRKDVMKYNISKGKVLYGLSDWFFANSGKLKKAYIPKD